MAHPAPDPGALGERPAVPPVQAAHRRGSVLPVPTHRPMINGHNHLYERIYPMRNNVVQAHVPPGGSATPATQGTTYICTGGGGAGLAASATSGWYGTSGGGDLATTGTGTPLLEVWGNQTIHGGSGGTSSEPDPVTGWSGYRRAQYCHLVIDVTAPKTWGGGLTSMHIRAIDPTQTGSSITSITNPAIMDSVTLVRKSVTGPTHGHGGFSPPPHHRGLPADAVALGTSTVAVASLDRRRAGQLVDQG